MKNYSADLVALLASGIPVYKVDLFAIGPTLNNQMIYVCNGSGPITFNGNTYQPVQSGQWSRDAISTKIGLESNSTRLTVITGSNVPVYFPGTSNSVLMNDGIKFGLLGMAPISIFTAYMTEYGKVTGPTGGSLVETKFVGEVAGAGPIGLTKAVIEVQDLIYRLNMQVPNRIVQASCSWVLYSAGCTLVAGSFTRTNTVGTATLPYLFSPSSNLATISPAGTFTQGTLIWTSGRNAGLASFVRQWTPGGSGADAILLDVAPIFPISSGDTFTITEGCDKSFASCLNLQGNTNAPLNFGGQPDTPVPETAI